MSVNNKELKSTLGATKIKSKATKVGKVFTNIKTNTGVYINKRKLTYGCRLTGVITDAAKSAFSILSDDKDKAEELFIDTIIFAASDHESIEEIAEVADNGWYFGTVKEPKVSSDISDKIRKMVLKDLNAMKGAFKDNNYNPISRLSNDDISIVMETLSSRNTLTEILDFSKQLEEELVKDKKASSNIGLGDFIERYAFKEHVLLAGPAGGGKTYTADKWLKDHGCAVEFFAGHSGVESTDLLGYSIRHTDGNFVWMDGPLTAAFRNAATAKTGLFIDELLRIPARELNILVGALTPNSSGEFVLRTNRILDITDGIGKSETLVVPCENLWVVATTNIGADYDVDDMDLALNDRFITHDVVTSDATISLILTSTNVNKLSDTNLNKLMRLYTAIASLVKAQELTNSMNVRHLTKVLKNVKEASELKSYLFDLAPNVCSRTVEGTLNKVELKIYKDTVKSIF